MDGKPETARAMTAVRIKVLINSDGRYAAYGYTEADRDSYDQVLYDMMSGEDDANTREYFVTAMVPTPERLEVVGEVEASSVSEVHSDG